MASSKVELPIKKNITKKNQTSNQIRIRNELVGFTIVHIFGCCDCVIDRDVVFDDENDKSIEYEQNKWLNIYYHTEFDNVRFYKRNVY